jgi:hypothetical protein
VLLKSTADGSLSDFTAGLNDAGGTAEKIAGQQMNSLSGQMTLLKSALDGVATGVGTTLLPMLTDLAISLTTLVQEKGPQITAIFEEFSLKLSETAGPAMVLINDALTRIGAAMGLTTGEVTGMDVVLKVLDATLDAVVIGVQAFCGWNAGSSFCG